MLLFMLAAGLILIYGAIYALFRMKKGGIAAAHFIVGKINCLYADIYIG